VFYPSAVSSLEWLKVPFVAVDLKGMSAAVVPVPDSMPESYYEFSDRERTLTWEWSMGNDGVENAHAGSCQLPWPAYLRARPRAGGEALGGGGVRERVYEWNDKKGGYLLCDGNGISQWH
jgi:hypothetical protein